MADDLYGIPKHATFYDAEHNVELGPLSSWGSQYDFSAMAIGDGFITPDGERWRVVDRWWSIENHTPMEGGLHLFIHQVEDLADDRPARVAPDYYRPGA